jgi:hypothetical protein
MRHRALHFVWTRMTGSSDSQDALYIPRNLDASDQLWAPKTPQLFLHDSSVADLVMVVAHMGRCYDKVASAGMCDTQSQAGY